MSKGVLVKFTMLRTRTEATIVLHALGGKSRNWGEIETGFAKGAARVKKIVSKRKA